VAAAAASIHANAIVHAVCLLMLESLFSGLCLKADVPGMLAEYGRDATLKNGGSCKTGICDSVHP